MRDTATRFTGLTVGLHWLMAFAMIGLLAVGLILEEMPRGDAKSALMWWHKALGVTVLVFAVWRVGWRFANGLPTLPGRGIGWQENAAIATHWLLLAGTLVMPVSGMMQSLAAGFSIDMFGLFTIGPFGKNDTAHDVAEVVHTIGGKVLIGAILLHLVGALKHHFFDKDGTLRRMLGADVSGAAAVREARR